jgi:prophage regulatory protein
LPSILNGARAFLIGCPTVNTITASTNEYLTPAIEDKSLQILKIGKVCVKCDSSRSFIYKAIRELGFPKPIKLGLRASGWRECDIDNWLASRAKAK